LATAIKRFFSKNLALLEKFSEDYVKIIANFQIQKKINLVSPLVDLFFTTKNTQIFDLIYRNVLLKLGENRNQKFIQWISEKLNSRYFLLREKISSNSRQTLEDLLETLQSTHKTSKKSRAKLSQFKESDDKRNKENEKLSGKDAAQSNSQNEGQPRKKAKLSDSDDDFSIYSNFSSSKICSPQIRISQTKLSENLKSQKNSSKALKKPRSKSSEPSRKKVKFDPKSNSVKVFDENAIVSKSSKVLFPTPGKSILKSSGSKVSKTSKYS
jgi:hypothetical protein